MLDDTELPPEVARRVREQMDESSKQCREQCAKEGEGSDEERIARARKCLDESECEAFMQCIKEVLGRD